MGVTAAATRHHPAPAWLAGLVCTLLLLLLPARAPAADTATARVLGELYTVALQMDAAVLDLNMLLGEDQSPVYKARLDATLKNLETSLKASGASLASSGVGAQGIQQLDVQVSAFIRLMRENRKTTLETGMPEGAVVDEMMLRRKDARKALDLIYAELEKRAGLAGSPLSEARELALLLQQMSALYVETAASAGGVSYRTQDAREATIDSLARSFSARLDKLGARARGEESAKLVGGIESKWRFIEKSMLNYRERTVPFLVDRYTQAIVTDLLKLADALERGA